MKNVRTQAFFFLLTILLSTTVFVQNQPIITVLDFTTSSISKGKMTAVAVFLSTVNFETAAFVKSKSFYLCKNIINNKNTPEVRTVNKLVA